MAVGLFWGLSVVAGFAGCQEARDPSQAERECASWSECAAVLAELDKCGSPCEARRNQVRERALRFDAEKHASELSERERAQAERHKEQERRLAAIDQACSVSMAECEAAIAQTQREQAACAGKDTPDCEEARGRAKRAESARGWLQTKQAQQVVVPPAPEIAERDAVRRREIEETKAFEAKLAREARAVRLAAKSEYAVPTISALICVKQTELNRLRRGGSTAEDVRAAEEDLKIWREALRHHAATAVPCTSLASTVACLARTGACTSEDTQRAELLSLAEAVLADPNARPKYQTALAPKPAPNGAPHGSIRVDSSASSEVWIGDRLMGRAPLIIERLPPGEVVIVLKSSRGNRTVKTLVRAGRIIDVDASGAYAAP